MNTSTVNRCRRSSQTATTPAGTSEDVPPAEPGMGDGDCGSGGGGVGGVTVTPSCLTKRDSEEDAWASKGYNYINPFVHRIEIDSHIEVAKVSLFSSPRIRSRAVEAEHFKWGAIWGGGIWGLAKWQPWKIRKYLHNRLPIANLIPLSISLWHFLSPSPSFIHANGGTCAISMRKRRS